MDKHAIFKSDVSDGTREVGEIERRDDLPTESDMATGTHRSKRPGCYMMFLKLSITLSSMVACIGDKMHRAGDSIASVEYAWRMTILW